MIQIHRFFTTQVLVSNNSNDKFTFIVVLSHILCTDLRVILLASYYVDKILNFPAIVFYFWRKNQAVFPEFFYCESVHGSPIFLLFVCQLFTKLTSEITKQTVFIKTQNARC